MKEATTTATTALATTATTEPTTAAVTTTATEATTAPVLGQVEQDIAEGISALATSDTDIDSESDADDNFEGGEQSEEGDDESQVGGESDPSSGSVFTAEEIGLLESILNPASDAAQDTEGQEAFLAPVSLRDEVSRALAEIEGQNFDAPGERALLGVIGHLVDRLEAIEATTGQISTQVNPVIEQSRRVQAESIVSTFSAAAREISAEFGQVATTDLIDIARNGGLEAYALLNGVDVTQVALTPSVIRAMYRMRNMDAVPVTKPRADHRALNTRKGGVSDAPTEGSLSEDEQIRRDIELASRARSR